MIDSDIVGHSLSWSRSAKSRENSPSREQAIDDKKEGKLQNGIGRKRRVIAPMWMPKFPASNDDKSKIKLRHNKRNKVKPLDVSLEKYIENLGTNDNTINEEAEKLPISRGENNISEGIINSAENVQPDFRPLGTVDIEALQDSITITDQLQKQFDDQTTLISILAYKEQLTDECMTSMIRNNDYGNECYDTPDRNCEETNFYRNTNINQQQTPGQYYTIPADLNYIFSADNLNISE